ncbi:ribosomal protein [Tanacetum coccineum]
MPQKKNSKAKKTGKCHVCGDTGHYARDCKERKSDSEEAVLQGTTRKCHVCGETGHYARECKDKKSDTVEVVLQDTTRKCHLCGYTGHYARDCKERKSDSKKVGLQDTTRKSNVYGETGHYAREYKYKKSDTRKVVLKEILGFETKSNMKAQGWYLAIGSSAHVCYSRDMFVDYHPKRNHELILDNNDHVDVAGIGTVVLRFTTGKVLTLSNVLHIPGISNCLVSVSKLDVLGYIMSLGGGACVIKKRDEVIGEGIDDGSSHQGDILSTRYRLSLLEEGPVKKVVLDETVVLLVSNEHPKLTKTRARGWYLTRCTVHVCNLRDMFVDYQSVTGHEVVLDNNSPVDVAGFGTVKLQLTSGRVLTLENVFHMPKIIKCCISVSKLTKMGFTVGFWGEGCDIKKDHDIVGNGYVEDGFYRLSVVDEHPSAADYDPMIDNEVNLDNDDHADDEANDSGFSMTCGGRKCVIKAGDMGLLMINEHPKLTEARARRWYLLTRCIVHVCNSRDMFVDYQPVTGHEVVLENNSHVNVVGYGTVKLQLTTGNVLTLNNVFHMPAIVKCCLSMNKLMEMGLGVAFHGEGCYVKKGDQIVGNGFVEEGLFRMGLIGEHSGGNQA